MYFSLYCDVEINGLCGMVQIQYSDHWIILITCCVVSAILIINILKLVVSSTASEYSAGFGCFLDEIEGNSLACVLR
jgi:hypothetical protein